MTPVAWVAGRPLDMSDVDTRERAVRAGPGGIALPSVDSSEGRQLRRWLVQLMAAERLTAAEARARGLDPDTAPELAGLAADRAALLELGSVAAALLAQSAPARAVFPAVTAHVRVDPGHVARYHAGNPERFRVPERRVVRHAIMTEPEADPGLADRPLRTLGRGELVGAVERAVFAAAAGDVVGPIRDPLGWHVLRLEAIEPARLRPLDEVRPEIERLLLAHARRRAFTAWLDGRMAEQVRLAPGYEHPGDPSQPDNTHRH
ncbi:MAG TPA: peptidylprolyl isomerase [Actinophytocola sp.]|uniref:peptidylprolyl isomerase n=1 Tax=Actinophytocola sp. TaxID=1872138 RepID=UPI002DDD532D|nr:peptidylprolyl isomerase [Actinophytocola sp.]HEV2779042.1 peptidylprolyl isomerase [Actinophytocola sp.]